MTDPKRGKRYRWIGEPGPTVDGELTWLGRRELDGEDLEMCSRRADCGGSCVLAPGHEGICSCIGDDMAPGDCPA